MGHLRRLGFLAFTLGLLVTAPIAAAQEYATEAGDLEITLEVTYTVTISGEGYVGDSVVYVTLIPTDGSDEIDLGTLSTDEAGRFFGELAIPTGLEPGAATVAATGVTSAGATRVLSTQIVLGQEPGPAPVPSATSSTAPAPTSTTTDPPAQDTESTEIAAGASEDLSRDFDRILAARVLMFGVVALGGVWWWIYRAVKR